MQTQPLPTDTDVQARLIALLIEQLQLGEHALRFDAATALFGSLPEFDSMSVVNVIGAMEESFGILVEDDDISAEVFATLGSLTRFVEDKLGV